VDTSIHKTPAIVGYAHTKFGKHESLSLEDLIVDVTQNSIANARIAASDIDAIFVGHFNAGLVNDGFPSSLAIQANDELRFKPATRYENACASGSAAIWGALDAINSGRIKVALVIGVEKMTNLDNLEVTQALGRASYQGNFNESSMNFPQTFAHFAKLYFDKYGDQSNILARIAAKNHHNALQNPLAHMQKDLGFDFCNTISDKNPIISPPLRKTDCSLVSDGAAAIIIVHPNLLSNFNKAVGFKSFTQINDFIPLAKRDILEFAAPQKAFSQAFNNAGITPDDLDFAEVHDCFTIAELLIYEAMGLTKPGKGKEVVENGKVYPDGDLPINLSGGLKAKGHPVGATGVSMHALAYMQLTRQAGAMQKKGASLGCVFNMGGSAVANYVSVLESIKS